MKNQRYLSQDDVAKLYQLAEHMLRLDGAEIDAAEELSDIVTSAVRLPAGSRRKDIALLGSSITFASQASGQSSNVTLVLPTEADPAQGRISVLTPIGLALIGRKNNALVDVNLPSGRHEKMRIIDIQSAEALETTSEP
ncbi:GreA/GreB family elongation factor [uncultured Oxalicibacterium sp.]|uniref:GreA/GreB family elongation factor n=1 Tax=uncultured Oxalicibacterium sp. TaxID=1168540 RepID=UPI0025F7E916|nr:GreA/GreB family elongation factor [uncultured Oxalicibacterium sp.]